MPTIEKSSVAPEPLSRIRTRKRPVKTTQVPLDDEIGKNKSSKISATDFAAVGVDQWLVNSLNAMAITKPTKIQSLCIPQILQGRDCIGGSKTGSGKTIAFTVPILQKWARDPFGIFAIILTPTR